MIINIINMRHMHIQRVARAAAAAVAQAALARRLLLLLSVETLCDTQVPLSDVSSVAAIAKHNTHTHSHGHTSELHLHTQQQLGLSFYICIYCGTISHFNEFHNVKMKTAKAGS